MGDINQLKLGFRNRRRNKINREQNDAGIVSLIEFLAKFKTVISVFK